MRKKHVIIRDRESTVNVHNVVMQWFWAGAPQSTSVPRACCKCSTKFLNPNYSVEFNHILLKIIKNHVLSTNACFYTLECGGYRGGKYCFLKLKNELLVFFQNEGMDDFMQCKERIFFESIDKLTACPGKNNILEKSHIRKK